MKIYVDPKYGGTTLNFKEENGKRQYLYVHDKEGFIIKNLEDYKKQIIKDVCERIKDLAGDYFDVHYCEICGETAYQDVILKGRDLTEILETIQKEEE